MAGQNRADNSRAIATTPVSPQGQGKGIHVSRESLETHHVLLLTVLLGSLVAATFVIHQFVQSGEGLALRTQTQADASQLAQKLHNELELELNPFHKLRDRWAKGEYKTVLEVADAARIQLNWQPRYGMIGGVDERNRCQWVRYPKDRARPTNVAGNAHWGPILSEARCTEQEAIVASNMNGPSRPILDAVIPLARRGATATQQAPALLMRLYLDRAMGRAISEHIRQEYSVELRDARGLVFSTGGSNDAGRGYGDTHPVQIGSTYWQLYLWPSDATVGVRIRRLAYLVLWGGLGGSVLFTVAMWRVLVYRSREIRQAREHLQALESLNEISTAISARLGSGREVLDQLAILARQLLGMSRSGIALLDEQRQCLKACAVDGDVSVTTVRELALNESPASRSCLESGQILFIEDTAKAAVSINQRAICETESSAVILIPLHIENRCIGLMALSDSHPRRFTSAERRLAKLLGSQASVILANNRLYEQTRRDAQTKAVLLRELHHRVKNNLAGIVGLLSINEPVLSPVARQWLDRVIERILTMARTHDLFSSGVDRVGVQRLIEQLLPSVAALKPADVLIQRVGQDDGELSTPQAVSLAMVLHELCNNAIQHGLRNRGTLTIQTRLVAGRLRIDVMDDGCGLPTGLCHGDRDNSRLEVDLSTGANNDEAFQSKGAIGVKVASAVQTHGLGLRLVRELVGRELHGTFQVCRRPEGGTIATIEFPLGSEVEGALP